jgi:hypothetical protein
MTEPLVLLKEHLANIYNLIETNNKALTDLLQKVTEEIGELKEEDRVSVEEFNKFVDESRKKWSEGLLEKVTGEIDKLKEEKLSVVEFNRFVDEFHKTLSEGLPALEKNTLEAENSKPEEETTPKVGAERQEIVVYAGQNQESEGAPQCVELINAQDAHREENTSEFVGFGMRTSGEIFRVSNDVFSVVGDAEIPSGTTVDASLVVKGDFKTGQNCTLLKDVKALGNLSIGENTDVEGNLTGGGKITVGPECVVRGSIASEGDVEIDENTIVEGSIRSKSSIVLKKCAKALQAIYATKGVIGQRAHQDV